MISLLALSSSLLALSSPLLAAFETTGLGTFIAVPPDMSDEGSVDATYQPYSSYTDGESSGGESTRLTRHFSGGLYSLVDGLYERAWIGVNDAHGLCDVDGEHGNLYRFGDVGVLDFPRALPVVPDEPYAHYAPVLPRVGVRDEWDGSNAVMRVAPTNSTRLVQWSDFLATVDALPRFARHFGGAKLDSMCGDVVPLAEEAVLPDGIDYTMRGPFAPSNAATVAVWANAWPVFGCASNRWSGGGSKVGGLSRGIHGWPTAKPDGQERENGAYARPHLDELLGDSGLFDLLGSDVAESARLLVERLRDVPCAVSAEDVVDRDPGWGMARAASSATNGAWLAVYPFTGAVLRAGSDFPATSCAGVVGMTTNLVRKGEKWWLEMQVDGGGYRLSLYDRTGAENNWDEGAAGATEVGCAAILTGPPDSTMAEPTLVNFALERDTPTNATWRMVYADAPIGSVSLSLTSTEPEIYAGEVVWTNSVRAGVAYRVSVDQDEESGTVTATAESVFGGDYSGEETRECDREAIHPTDFNLSLDALTITVPFDDGTGRELGLRRHFDQSSIAAWRWGRYGTRVDRAAIGAASELERHMECVYGTCAPGAVFATTNDLVRGVTTGGDAAAFLLEVSPNLDVWEDGAGYISGGQIAAVDAVLHDMPSLLDYAMDGAETTVEHLGGGERHYSLAVFILPSADCSGNVVWVPDHVICSDGDEPDAVAVDFNLSDEELAVITRAMADRCERHHWGESGWKGTGTATVTIDAAVRVISAPDGFRLGVTPTGASIAGMHMDMTNGLTGASYEIDWSEDELIGTGQEYEPTNIIGNVVVAIYAGCGLTADCHSEACTRVDGDRLEWPGVAAPEHYWSEDVGRIFPFAPTNIVETCYPDMTTMFWGLDALAAGTVVSNLEYDAWNGSYDDLQPGHRERSVVVTPGTETSGQCSRIEDRRIYHLERLRQRARSKFLTVAGGDPSALAERRVSDPGVIASAMRSELARHSRPDATCEGAAMTVFAVSFEAGLAVGTISYDGDSRSVDIGTEVHGKARLGASGGDDIFGSYDAGGSFGEHYGAAATRRELARRKYRFRNIHPTED